MYLLVSPNLDDYIYLYKTLRNYILFHILNLCFAWGWGTKNYMSARALRDDNQALCKTIKKKIESIMKLKRFFLSFIAMGWLVVNFKANCLTWDLAYGWSALRGDLSKGS